MALPELTNRIPHVPGRLKFIVLVKAPNVVVPVLKLLVELFMHSVLLEPLVGLDHHV